MKPESRRSPFLRYNAGKWESLDRGIIVETPVSLTVNGQVWLTLMCTPIDLEALAVGFLFNEGALKNRDEVELVRVCQQGDNVDVWLNHPVEQPKDWRRTSGCTGGVTAVIHEQLHPELRNGFTLTPEAIQTHIEILLETQSLYREVGGVHNSILSDGKCVVASGEDVGRHNSLDKIAGKCLLDDLNPSRRVLVTTGRVSSEMIQKAARIGASVVISRTSASSLSVTLAEKWGITLIGYARSNQFTVYAHSGRILQPAESVYTAISH
ncbi:Sulfur carrier protein FdhD [Anaerolineales bacterium]|nr:Sulfur carrier protein FdhD [Anaerolineales bacterium]